MLLIGVCLFSFLVTTSDSLSCFSDQDCCFQFGTICSIYGQCVPQPRFLGDQCSRSVQCQVLVDINTECVNQMCVCRIGYYDQMSAYGPSRSCVRDDVIGLSSYGPPPQRIHIGIFYLRILSDVLRLF